MVRWRTFARDVRAARDGRTMRELQREAGMSAATVCRAERGRSISVDHYFALCMTLALDPWAYYVDRREPR
jgi:uncharacterized protein YerC